jgi:serine/threonine-protein kinase
VSVLSAGSLVAGYRIERVLGVGGMGTVYLAANPTLPRFDALKVLSPELSRDADFRARFTREADVAAALQHPQIVAVYNRGVTDDGQLWIAMQYVAGTDADDALRAGTMTPQRAVHITGEVAKALDFAHQRNVVHRDIKPANFLLSGPVGASEQALLGDFGIARALDDVSLTATGNVMATAAYAAPEVLSGLRFDGRADIYSLGCTLFRLLTGKTPFLREQRPSRGDAGPPATPATTRHRFRAWATAGTRYRHRHRHGKRSRRTVPVRGRPRPGRQHGAAGSHLGATPTASAGRDCRRGVLSAHVRHRQRALVAA